MIERTKTKIDLVIITIVFMLTGLTTAVLSGIFMNALGAEPWSIIYICGYLFFAFPLYQSVSLVYAFLFGKFNWFYSGQKFVIYKIAGIANNVLKK